MRNRPAVLLPLLLLLAVLSLAFGLAWGSVPLRPAAIWQALLDHPASMAGEIVWQLRLPRVFSAFACGGLLALAGLLLQVLLKNPLADPYILGVSGGASVAGLLALLLGVTAIGLNIAAFLGALAAIALVFALSRRSRGWRMEHLLLTGVVLSAACGAVISLLLTLAPGNDVRGMLFWLMGDLSHAQSPGLSLAVLAASLLASLALAPALNILQLGERKAQALGVAGQELQVALYFLASLATAVAVMEGGAIGFVGLVIPHLLRLAGVHDHRFLVPMTALAGGSFLTLADTAARTVVAPIQLPVGVITALLGAPLLLLLLARQPLEGGR